MTHPNSSRNSVSQFLIHATTPYERKKIAKEKERKLRLEKETKSYSNTTPGYSEIDQYRVRLVNAYNSRSRSAIFSAIIDLSNAYARENNSLALNELTEAMELCNKYKDIPNCFEITVNLHEKLKEQFGSKP
mgnify:CR=1 FL=1